MSFLPNSLLPHSFEGQMDWTDADDRLGFAHLNPQFGIRFGGPDKTRLPSACKLTATVLLG
jgi:hypothetical protein